MAALPSHAFEVDPSDHCETPRVAYAHLKPMLDAIRALTKKADVTVYDPYYCAGSAVANLASVGYPNVVNRNEDFYAAIEGGKTPAHDIVVTNPPYSGDHIERCLCWCIGRHNPEAIAEFHEQKREGVNASKGKRKRATAAESKAAKQSHVAVGAARSQGLTGFSALRDSDDEDDDASSDQNSDGDDSIDGHSQFIAPWCALIPQYVSNKPFFHELRQLLTVQYEGRGWGSSPFLFVGPANAPYEFTAPAGARPSPTAAASNSATSKAPSSSAIDAPPIATASTSYGANSTVGAPTAVTAGVFQCVWFIGGLGPLTQKVAERLGLSTSDDDDADDESTPRFVLLGGEAQASSDTAKEEDKGGDDDGAFLARDAAALPSALQAHKATPAERRFRKKKGLWRETAITPALANAQSPRSY